MFIHLFSLNKIGPSLVHMGKHGLVMAGVAHIFLFNFTKHIFVHQFFFTHVFEHLFSTRCNLRF